MKRLPAFSLLLAAALLAACSKTQGPSADESTGGGGTDATAGAGGTDSILVTDTTAASGSRLRAQYLTTTDGTRQFHGWLDKNLGISCHFASAEDGEPHCLPNTTATLSSAFADAQCLQPLVQIAAGCSDAPSYVLQSSSGECGPTAQVFAVGAAQAPTKVYYTSGTDCVPSDPPANQKLFALGAKVDASTFQGGMSAGVPSGNRLDPVYTLGSDGSKERTGWFDTMNDSACTISVAADGKSRCLPTPSAIVQSTFADSGCSQPLAQSIATTCDAASAPSLAFSVDTSACPATKTIYARTAQFSGLQVWVEQGTSCTPVTATGASYYQVTPINPPEFELFLEVQPGAARLRPEALVDAEGDSEFGATLFDSARNESCTFANAADGQVRCLPDGAGVLFSDAQCTMSLGVASPSCASSTPAYARLARADSCPSDVSVFPIGATTSARNLFGPDVDGKCSATSAPSATLYTVGAELAPSAFALATLTTE